MIRSCQTLDEQESMCYGSRREPAWIWREYETIQERTSLLSRCLPPRERDSDTLFPFLRKRSYDLLKSAFRIPWQPPPDVEWVAWLPFFRWSSGSNDHYCDGDNKKVQPLSILRLVGIGIRRYLWGCHLKLVRKGICRRSLQNCRVVETGLYHCDRSEVNFRFCGVAFYSSRILHCWNFHSYSRYYQAGGVSYNVDGRATKPLHFHWALKSVDGMRRHRQLCCKPPQK